MSDELVSVLVPAYNHERYVSRCLSALAAQSYRRMELLIRDDASTDRTAAVVEATIPEIRSAFDRVVFVRGRTNVGVATSLNVLLGEARGTYLFVNASDDVAEPHAVERLLDTLRNEPRAALAVGDNAIIDVDGHRVGWSAHRAVVDTAQARYTTFVEYLRAVHPSHPFDRNRFGRMDTLRHGNHVPNGKLLRAGAVRAIGGWMPGTVEDWDLNFRLARYHRLRFVDEVLMGYRWHGSNTILDDAKMSPAQRRTAELIRLRMRNPLVWLRLSVHRSPLRRFRAWRRARRRASAQVRC